MAYKLDQEERPTKSEKKVIVMMQNVDYPFIVKISP